MYRQFEATTDTHRRPITVASRGYLLNPLALVVLLGLLAWKNPEGQKTLRPLLLLSVLIWAYVGGMAILQKFAGPLPVPIQISMPARFSNLSAMMLIPLAVAVIARVRLAPTILTGLLLIQAILTPSDPVALEHYLFFFIAGAALLAHLLLRGPKLVERLWLLPSWCVSAVFLVTLLISLGIPTNAALTARRARVTGGYRFLPYYEDLRVWLAAHASPDEPILVPMGPPSELQPKIGHPVIMELETLYMMTYRPDLASIVGPMARDFYGLDYLDPARLAPLLQAGRISPGSRRLTAVWQSRTADEWRQLGRKYNFRFVLSLTSVPLPLTTVFPGSLWTLYSIE